MSKKMLALLCALLLCGCSTDNGSDSKAKPAMTKAESSDAVKEKQKKISASADKISASADKISASADKISASADIGKNGEKAVTHVKLTPQKDMDISDKVRFTDLYGKHALHGGVVGRVGSPVNVDYDPQSIGKAVLTFTYDPNRLEGVRPDALMFLYYNESQNNYEELKVKTLDTKNHTVSIDIERSGAYMLVNGYKWLNTWGANLDDNGLEKDYNPNEAELSAEKWSANCRTGDILKLADMDYIKESTADGNYSFKITNVRELASLVYYVNCAPNTWSSERPCINAKLESDIDLNGIDWVPMGWSGAGLNYGFHGTFDGNGHVIKNMTIKESGKAGFIGSGNYEQVYNLKFTNADVSGNKVGVIVGEDYCGRIKRCSVQGYVTGSYGGALGGYCSRTDFIDCVSKVKVNGKLVTDIFDSNGITKKKAMAKHKPKEKITVDKNHIVHRKAGLENKYQSITWQIGTSLERAAEKETALDLSKIYDKQVLKYGITVTLLAYIDGAYIPISNSVNVKF